MINHLIVLVIYLKIHDLHRNQKPPNYSDALLQVQRDLSQKFFYLIIVISPFSFHNQLKKKTIETKFKDLLDFIKTTFFPITGMTNFFLLISLTSCPLSDSAGEMIKSMCAKNKCLPC